MRRRFVERAFGYIGSADRRQPCQLTSPTTRVAERPSSSPTAKHRRAAGRHPAGGRTAHQGMGSRPVRARSVPTLRAPVAHRSCSSARPPTSPYSRLCEHAWPADVPLIELPLETDLVVLAAVLERLSLFITGDTGPMHLAAAVGTPVLAIFGPSLPTRYAPLSPRSRIVRIDIHCSPVQPACAGRRHAVSAMCPTVSRASTSADRAPRRERNAGRVMTSRPLRGLAVCAAFVAMLSAFPPIVERLLPPTGLTRSVFTQVGFRGVPVDASTFDINLGFLDQDSDPAPPELLRTLARIFLRVRYRRRSNSLPAATTKWSCASMARCWSRGISRRGCVRSAGESRSTRARTRLPSTISSSAAEWR